MFKKINIPLLIIIILEFTFIACQKQDVVQPTPVKKPNSTAISLARTDNKNYRIPLDSAVAYTTAWRQKNEASFNNGVPNSFTLSIETLQQLLTEATDNHTNLYGIRIYLGATQAGKINIMAVPVNKTNDDILHYEGEANTVFPTIYFQPPLDAPCPPTCNLVPNILNTNN